MASSARNTGRLTALASAIAFGLVAPLAGLAYAGGAIPATVIEVRLLAGLLGIMLAVVLLRRRWFVARHAWGATLGIGVAWLVVSVGYMASFYYIPVSLAAVIFFTFPVQIAVVGPLIDGRRPPALMLVAALIALAGLALAMGPSFSSLDWRGCALAFVAAVGIATTFIASRHLIVAQDMFTFSLDLHLVCAAAVVAYLVYAGGMALPTTATAGMALAGVGVFYVCAVLLQFAAIRAIGPDRAAIIFNTEPVVALIAAALLLDEHLTGVQMLGAALVVAGMLLSTMDKRPATIDPIG